MTQQRGFTLIEIAIVLVIITILIGGLAAPLSAQIQARRIAETNKTLEEAKEAIIGYAMTHRTSGATPRPYLPCPDTDGDGRENRASLYGTNDSCLRSYGYFPWVDMGGAPHDAWGNRLRYIVEFDSANKTKGFYSYTSLPASNWKQIASTHGCATVDVAANVPFVLISHGPNGWGARNVNNNTLATPTSSDELDNVVDDDGCYVSRSPSKPGDAAGEFDDILAWMSFGTLIGRVCPSGGCL